MADDLSQFFAKKTQKSKEKKKGVIKLDAVGQQLERKVKLQEERDREDEEEERHQQAEEIFLKSRKDPEDSEWLDYNDPNKEIKLAEFGIKDMNFTEQAELYYDEEEEKATPSEPTKTWKVLAAQDENQAPVDLPPPPSADGFQAKYVPAHMRNASSRLRGSATPDISNQELFPSLAAADQIEKHQRDNEKREEQRRMEFNEKQSKMAEERQAALNMVKQVNPNAYQPPARRGEQPSEASSAQSQPSSQQQQQDAANLNPNAYVPPHMRKSGGGGGGERPSEPAPSPRSGGSPWGGNRDHSAPAPPPPATNNRFASLKD